MIPHQVSIMFHHGSNPIQGGGRKLGKHAAPRLHCRHNLGGSKLTIRRDTRHGQHPLPKLPIVRGGQLLPHCCRISIQNDHMFDLDPALRQLDGHLMSQHTTHRPAHQCDPRKPHGTDNVFANPGGGIRDAGGAL